METHASDLAGEDGYAFAVEDTGVGMSEEDKAEVFEAFQQADPSLTREHEGTGLGLVITRNFCPLMGGDVTVESEEGVGSTFTMRLPAELEGTHEEQETQAQKQAPDATLEEKTGETSSGEPFADGLDEEQAGGPVPAAEAGFDEDENTVLVIDDERARGLIGLHLPAQKGLARGAPGRASGRGDGQRIDRKRPPPPQPRRGDGPPERRL